MHTGTTTSSLFSLSFGRRMRTFGEIQFFGLEIEKMVIVGTGDGYETLHIMVGNDYFLTATGISNILQISNLRLKSLHFGRTCVDKNQITDDGNQSTDFLTLTDTYLILHGDFSHSLQL